MLNAVRIKLIIINQVDSDPAPKTMGIGPINTTPPTLPDPPDITVATIKTATPIKTRTLPKSKKLNKRLDKLKSVFIASSPNGSYLNHQQYTTVMV
jgi:hypothetical protein